MKKNFRYKFMLGLLGSVVGLVKTTPSTLDDAILLPALESLIGLVREWANKEEEEAPVKK